MEQPPATTTQPDSHDSSILVSVLADEPAAGEGAGTSPLGRPPRKPDTRVLAIVGALAVALLLLAGAVWWALGRGSGGDNVPQGVGGLPGDAIALINSSTPIPVRVPRSGADVAGKISRAPDADGWAPPLHEAYRALKEGRYASAISQFSALVGNGRNEDARGALWGLAETYEASGQRELALRAYALFTSLDDSRSVRALYRVATLNEAAGRDSEAARLFGEYAKLGGPAKHAAMLREARLLGPTAEAEGIFNAVLAENPLDVDRREALIGLAEAQARRGNHAAARDTYDKLAALQSSSPRPVLDRENVPAPVLAAEEARVAGDLTGTRKRLLDYIGSGCISEAAPCLYFPFGRHSAINGLLKVDANAVVSGTVSPMLAAQTAYDGGYYARAIQYLDTARAQSEDPALRARAALLTGKSYQASGNAELAYNWYTATVQVYPQSSEAPEGIRRAADMLARQGQWDAALSVYREALARYPNLGEETLRARINGGLLAYRLDKPDEALNLLRPALTGASLDPALRAEAAFWIAKVEKSKGNPAWRDTLRPVPTLVPGDYLDFRAQSLLASEPDGGPLAPTFAQANIDAASLGVLYSDEATERQELLDWAAQLPVSNTPTITHTVTTTPTRSRTATATLTPPSTLPTPKSTPNLSSPTPTRPSAYRGAWLAKSLQAQSVTPAPQSAIRSPQAEIDRAMLLVELGDSRATLALRALAESLARQKDWEGLARLSLYARYHADPRAAIRVADRLNISVEGNPLARPSLLLKTLYPTPYGDLVVAEARGRDLDPLIMYALMRQESQFVTNARSSADARGLTQVIPSTGAGIAEQLGDTGYRLEDLYLPQVSIRYGTYYLASNLPQFDRKLIPTLAAYNGGPGNAARWLDGSALRDPDLYIERVDLFETEGYLRVVYANYGFYRAAYLP